MNEKLRAALQLFQAYCRTFGMKPVAKATTIKEWEHLRGPMVAAAFVGDKTSDPPVAHVTATGDIIMEQDEDLLSAEENPVAVIDEELIRIAITQKKPIHTTFVA